MELELDQIITKEGEVDFYDFFYPANPKNIHFNCEPKEQSRLLENFGLQGPTDVRSLLQIAAWKAAFRENLVQRAEPSPTVGLSASCSLHLNRRFRIKFSPRYECRSWKIGWCLNYLKDQVVSSTDPSL